MFIQSFGRRCDTYQQNLNEDNKKYDMLPTVNNCYTCELVQV